MTTNRYDNVLSSFNNSISAAIAYLIQQEGMLLRSFPNDLGGIAQELRDIHNKKEELFRTHRG